MNASGGAASTCVNGSPPVDYDVDDFGNVVAVRVPWSGAGTTSETRFEYNALGLVTRRETQVMRNGGVYETFTYDQLGRLTSRLKQGVGGTAQLFALTYDAPVTGTNCPSAATARVLGRLGYRDDSFGRTGYSYDPEGRVVSEWGQRSGSVGTQCLVSASYNNAAVYPTTQYAYSANGNLTSIRYPQGRTVSYAYGSGALSDRVGSISTTTWNNTTQTWDAAGNLIVNIQWRPYGGLKQYDTLGAEGFTTEYLTNGSPTAALSNACTQTDPVTGDDFSGRVTLIRTGNASGAIMRKFYRWQGEELLAEHTCYPRTTGNAALAQTSEERKTFTYDQMHRLTNEARLGLPRMDQVLGGAAYNLNGPGNPQQGTATTYNSRSNRTAQTVDGCAFNYSIPSGANRDLINVVTPSTGSCQGRFSGPTLTWDADGRLSRHTDAYGFWYTDFGYGAAANGGLDSVFHSASISQFTGPYNGSGTYATTTFQYYYDAFNRRRLKILPTGATQEFFYGGEKQLLSEVTSPTPSGGSPYAIEDHVWLDGMPVALIRGSMLSSGGNWVRGVETFTSSCSKLSDGGFCGRYYLFTDLQKRPFLMVRRDTAEITQAANYDAFGNVNRIPMVSGVNNNDPGQIISRATLPAGKNWVRVRANYVVAPVNGVALNGTTVFTPSSVPKVNAVSGFVFHGTAANTPVTLNLTGAGPTPSGGLPGLQVNELEYFRTSNSVGLFTPLRFPGQYYDPELDLVENWNRYYFPNLGRYLSPEPLMDTAFLVRQVLGRSAPALPFGFVGNNPVRFADPDGRRISPTVDVSYDPNGGFVLVEGREKVLRPGTQVASAYVAWQRGCGPDGRGGFKFDAEVRVNIDVRLNGDGDRPSRQDGDACTISRHEDKHVDDLVDDIFDIERAFQSEGFRTRGECDAAFERLTNASNPVPEQRGEAFRQFLRSISEATRSRRDPFEYAR